MLTKRFKYQLRALFDPRCWTRIGEYDAEWDQWLWNSVEADLIEVVGNYEAVVDGQLVWIANHPYGSGAKSTLREVLDIKRTPKTICSRATALYLADALPKIRVLTRLTYTHNAYQQFVYNDQVIG